MCQVPKYSSSHLTAEMCNQFQLKHLVALHQARFIKRLRFTKSSLFLLNFYHFSSGCLFSSVLNFFDDTYKVNILNNDIDVIQSRIQWVQLHEPYSQNIVNIV